MELNYLKDSLVELDEDEQLKIDGGVVFFAFALHTYTPAPSRPPGC